MMIKNGVSRRKLLEMTNSAFLLYPLLQTLKLSEARAAGAIIPRVVFTHASCGVAPADFWNLTGSGPLGTLPKILSPLEAHKADMIQLRGVCTRGSSNHDGGPGQVLAGYGKLGGVPLDTSIATSVDKPYSLDQMLGDRWGEKTAKKAILLGSGTSTPTLNPFISYNKAGVGQPSVDNPKAAFDSIFGGFKLTSGGSSALRLASDNVTSGRKRIIDYLRGDLRKISSSLGDMERKMFESHFTTLDDISKEIIKQDAAATVGTTSSSSGGTLAPGTVSRLIACSPSTISGLPADTTNYAAVRSLNNQIMVQALACGITRVGVMVFASSDTTLDYGNGGSYHGDSHGDLPGLAVAQTAFMGSVAELITLLKAVKTVDATLFDETLVCFTSDLGENPGDHTGINVPWLLLGRLGGKLKGGRQISFPYTPGLYSSVTNGMDHNRVLISVAALLGEPDIKVIGNTAFTGTVPEIVG
ncbi:MAG: DUF1552 domain-containing protein [Chitinophagaceae bacterium]|nr:DUF1552 domain-containing protein [Oligoflexus sp.]